MKTTLIALLAAGALVGCNNRDRDDMVEQKKEATQENLNAQKEATDEAAEAARERVDAQSEAAKAQITAQEKARKAQIEANKEKVEAQADAQKEIIDAQQDAADAQGTPGAVQSGTARDGQLQRSGSEPALADQTIRGRITAINSPAGTLTVTDAKGRQEFKLENEATLARLKEGESVTITFHRQDGTNIVHTVDVTNEQQPPQR